MENFDMTNYDNKIEELDLKYLINLILRNKKFIISITIISFFVSCLIGLSRKKVWQGQFEIVLSKSKDKKTSSLLGALEDFNLSNIASSKTESLNTEIGILESPLVLMPVFEYVKEKKLNKNLLFSGWKQNNLKTKLRKKTSILNISYNDENKELIIPVLQKISSTYQEYSGKRSKRSNQLANDYLKDQIKIFRDKSKKTRKIAITYAIENDLTFSDMEGATIYDDSALDNLLPGIKNINPNQFETYLNTFKSSNSSSSNIRGSSIESIRVSAANEIKNIDFQIEKIQKLKEVEDLQYLGSTIPSLLNLGLPQILEDIETDLVELKSKYTSNDISIKRLMDKRELYSKLLKERSLGYLKARKLASQALLESVERPKGTTIKGKELMREANRDEETLVQLENKLRQVQLMSAKLEDPWELITTPTLQNIPIKPNKRKIALIGTLIGFIFGTAISLFKEKRSQLIFEEEELESLFSLPILKRLKFEDGQIQESTNELKFNEIKKVSKEKLRIFLTSGLVSNYLKDLENYFSKLSIFDKEIEFITEDLPNSTSKDSFFLLTSLEKIDYPEITNIKKRFEYNKINLSGIILLTNT